MAALAALGVDNATVELDGPKCRSWTARPCPSCRCSTTPAAAARTRRAATSRSCETVEVVDGDKRAALKPADRFEVAFEIHFGRPGHRPPARRPGGGRGSRSARELADCRTFGFLHEVEALRAMGLARGGSMDNAVVIEGDRVLNPEGLRRARTNSCATRRSTPSATSMCWARRCIGRFEGVLRRPRR